MSDAPRAEASHDELPDPVNDFDLSVEKQNDGYAVVKSADGEESVVETHADEESAQMHADRATDAATRHEGAAKVEEIPEGYPGKGVDETQA